MTGLVLADAPPDVPDAAPALWPPLLLRHCPAGVYQIRRWPVPADGTQGHADCSRCGAYQGVLLLPGDVPRAFYTEPRPPKAGR